MVDENVAIVGMACLFPGAPDLDSFWRNVRDGVDAISDAPAHRWDPVFYDPASDESDRLPCRRGGFIDEHAVFHPLDFGIAPVVAERTEPDQLLALETANEALLHARQPPDADRRRWGVVLGRVAAATTGHQRIEQHVRGATQLVEALRTLIPSLGPAELARIKREFQSKIAVPGPDAIIGASPNLTASRVAHRLNMQGPAYTIDAACASSLVALDIARKELLLGTADLMLCGGVHLCHTESFWSTFARLGALSRTGHIRPFDERADGLLIGEGVGILVLKRETDARRDRDCIYAIVRGVGVASDGRSTGLMSPSVDGQFACLERAWMNGSRDPDDMELIEAHGTGTPVGDSTELQTLSRFLGSGGRGEVVIGSVKSGIGHAMGAAGAAGLIKAALAVYHGVFPPTLHCERPRSELLGSRLRPCARHRLWAGARRLAGIDAFGFGGINAHVILENNLESRAVTKGVMHGTHDPPPAAFAAETPAALVAALDAMREGAAGRYRLVLRDRQPETIAKARRLLERGRSVHSLKFGIYYSPGDLIHDGAKIAVLFPGLDSAFDCDADEFAALFGFPAPEHHEPTPLGISLRIVQVNHLAHSALERLGLRVDMVAGHSLGELNAIAAAGVLTPEGRDGMVRNLHPDSLPFGQVASIAASCGVECVETEMADLTGLELTHDNCPHQVVVAGPEASIAELKERLQRRGVTALDVAFTTGAHTARFRERIGPFEDAIRKASLGRASVPLYSGASADRYPDDPVSSRALAVSQLSRRVRFRELILRLYADGARVFLQAGSGHLVGFIQDVLRGRPHVALATMVKDRPARMQMTHLLCTAWVEGLVASSTLPARDSDRALRTSRPMKLALGLPLVRFATPLAHDPSPPDRYRATDESGDAVRAALATCVHDAARAQSAVLGAASDASSSVRAAVSRNSVTFARTLSVAATPELLDHAFFRQPRAWPSVSDRQPVVPMTGILELMRAAAQQFAPARVVVGLDEVIARRQLRVDTPVEVQIHCRGESEDRCRVEIAGYADGVAILGGHFPEGGPLATESGGPRSPIAADEVYADRWMFHGVAYQGISRIDIMGCDGIRGEVRALPGLGATLDSAAQLFGIWLAFREKDNRLALPARIGRVRWFGPTPAEGERLSVSVAVKHADANAAVAEVVVGRHGRVWAVMGDFEARRYQTDDRLWDLIRWPEKKVLSMAVRAGPSLYADTYTSALSRDYLMYRYLGDQERREFLAKPPAARRNWLAGRIAVKDEVRRRLWMAEGGPMFPGEVLVSTSESGAPRLTNPQTPLHLSIAHSDGLAAALAGTMAVGVDVEKIESRSPAFERTAFDPKELAMVANDDRDEWVTRLWCAKEAVAKASGNGLSGDPRRFSLDGREGDLVRFGDQWVKTLRWGEHAVAWTVNEDEENAR